MWILKLTRSRDVSQNSATYPGQTIEKKRAENGVAGLRSTRLQINCFSKATFTIWLLKKKGQLNSV